MNFLNAYSLILTATYLSCTLSNAAIRSFDDNQASIRTDAPIIPTSSGKLRGLHVVKSPNFDGYQYLGVPFAAPPVGKLRFQRPQPLNGSSRIERDATKMAPTCIQMRHLQQLINPLLDVDEKHRNSEDCLYLNIYVPKNSLNQKKALPVMVWLPGEGYDFADARQYDGSYLSSLGNVIVITVQYRVGVFGFLHDGSISSGNMGLWDQIEALKWIKKNVHAFNGDSDNVTVFGRFTGSMSISILLTSPLLRSSGSIYDLPLFKRAILLSGVAVGKWVFDTNPQSRAQELFAAIGCRKGDVSCIQNVSAEKILDKALFGWRPTFDSQLVEEEPINALEKGHFAYGVTEVMMGTNEVEGSLCLLTHFATKSKYYDKIVNNDLSENDYLEMIEADMRMFLGETFGAQNATNYQNRILISSIIHKNQNTSFRQKYLDFCSSLLITSHMETFNKLLVKRHQTKQNKSNYTFTNTYSYKLQYRPTFSIAPRFVESAAHGDDVLLAFGLIHGSPIAANRNDEKMSQLVINAFTNFARFGNPNGNSEPLNTTNLSSHQTNHWSNQESFLIKLHDNVVDKRIDDTKSVDIVETTQLFVFSSTAEVLLTFLTTSTTILALMATILIGFIIYALNNQRHTTSLKKTPSLL